MTETIKPKSNRNRLFALLIVLLVLGLGAGAVYFYYAQKRVYIEKSEISAPQINLSPETGGPLNEIYVKAGDLVKEDTVVARVGDELIKTKTAGLIIDVNDDIGKNFNRGETVVSLISPQELRVVGHLDENSGLPDVRVGQRAIFTVDAFGSQEFVGAVDEISPTSRESGVVFNISDKRETKQFDIKIKFDTDQYQELKNGMSAKLWIYKE